MILVKPEPIPFEAGELFIANDDAITPTRLKMLGEDGWSIQDASVKQEGFTLLLTRRIERPVAQRVMHEGGSRCPNYCSCATRSNTR